MNGSSTLCVSPATVTCFSCMASSNALWVLGVARLISSASRMLANTGPGWNWKLFRPCSSSRMMFVPMMSEGIRSGVNCTRENFRFTASASVRTSIVLPRPGTPSSNTCPAAKNATSTPSMISS